MTEFKMTDDVKAEVMTAFRAFFEGPDVPSPSQPMTDEQRGQIAAAQQIAQTMRGKTAEEIRAALIAQGYAAAVAREVKA